MIVVTATTFNAIRAAIVVAGVLMESKVCLMCLCHASPVESTVTIDGDTITVL